ncbi:MAG: Ig-like domain-containing protein [Pseudomonadota bacterium]
MLQRFPGVLACLIGCLALSLVGCGGGVYVGLSGTFDDDDDDDAPPSVSMAATPSTLRAGEVLNLVAAAADASGIARVQFYRLDLGASVLIGTDDLAPYELSTAVPADGRLSASYYARATDGYGDFADSAPVVVTVRP